MEGFHNGWFLFADKSNMCFRSTIRISKNLINENQES